MTNEQFKDKMVDLSIEMARLVAENMHLQKELRKNMIAQMKLVQSYQPLFEDYYAGNQKTTVWHSCIETPEDLDKIYICRGVQGHVFLSYPINRDYWIKNVHEWTEVPV